MRTWLIRLQTDLTWLADSEIKRGLAPISAYTTSAFYSGVMLAYNRTGDKKYLDFVNFQMDMLLYPEVSLFNSACTHIAPITPSSFLFNFWNVSPGVKKWLLTFTWNSMMAASCFTTTVKASMTFASVTASWISGRRLEKISIALRPRSWRTKLIAVIELQLEASITDIQLMLISMYSLPANQGNMNLNMDMNFLAMEVRSIRIKLTWLNRMWLDGIYMLDVFYARWTHTFEPGNTTAWDDIALQVCFTSGLCSFRVELEANICSSMISSMLEPLSTATAQTASQSSEYSMFPLLEVSIQLSMKNSS